jgi:hypothetical protein
MLRISASASEKLLRSKQIVQIFHIHGCKWTSTTKEQTNKFVFFLSSLPSIGLLRGSGWGWTSKSTIPTQYVSTTVDDVQILCLNHTFTYACACLKSP